MWRNAGCYRWLRYQYFKLLRINDSPEKVAGGLALGVALGVLPSFGLGIIMALVLAGFLRLNRAAAVIGTLAMNPWTTPFFWGISYMSGSLVMGNDLNETIDVVKEIRAGGDLWKSLLARKLIVPYVVGNVIVTAASSATFYVAGLYSVRGYRKAKARRLEKRRAKWEALGTPR